MRRYSKDVGIQETIGSDDDVDLDECVMLGGTLSAKVQIDAGLVAFCIFKVKSIKDKDGVKFETVISGISVGKKVFTGVVLEGKAMGNDLALKVSKRIREEITVGGTFAICCKIQNMLLSLSEASSLFVLLPLYEANSKTYKLLPYHAALTEASHIEQTEQGTFKCKLCNKPMGRKKMRQHIGSHILKDNLENVCGFCGVQGCDIDISCGSGRGKTVSEVPQSRCDFYEKFSIKAAANGSKRSPCTNRPIHCPVCTRVVWFYNMSFHYQPNHPDCPRNTWLINDDEKISMQKLCQKTTKQDILYICFCRNYTLLRKRG